MTIIKIDPWKKEVKLGKIEPLDDNDENTIEDLIKNSENIVSVEEDLKIITYPMFDKEPSFFYYITTINKDKKIVRVFSFKGIGIAIGNVNKERIEEIKNKIIWH